MRKTIVSLIARSIMLTANTGANAASEANGATPETETEKKITQVEEGAKGKIGAANPAMVAEAERQSNLIADVLAAKNAIVVPADHASADYKKLVVEMSTYAKETGDAIGAANVSSAKAWPMFEALCPMTLNEKTGKMDAGKFCKSIWDLMTPDVKLENPLKPGEFFAWNEARKNGNSAARTIENVRNYIRNNGPRLYPQFFPKVDAEVEKAAKAANETFAPLRKASKEVADILALTYLPATQFVELDENGAPKAGATPVTLSDMLKRLKAAIDAQLPAPVTEAEKVSKLTAEQLAEEIAAEKAELEQLRAEKAELLKEKQAAEKAKVDAAFQEKIKPQEKPASKK